MKHSHPVAPMTDNERTTKLRKLTENARRMANTLASLTPRVDLDDEKTVLPLPADTANPVPRVTSKSVSTAIKVRRLRALYFPEDLFADPAWDILLDLLQAEADQVRVSVSSLCIAAAVPPTTALRWIKTLTERGLIVRRADPHDGRRVFIELSPSSSDAIHRYFQKIDVLQTE